VLGLCSWPAALRSMALYWRSFPFAAAKSGPSGSPLYLLILLATRIATDPRCLVVLDPHQHGAHTFMISMVLGLVSLTLAAPQRSKPGHSGAAVQSKGYRKEKRHPQTFRLQLSSTSDVSTPESAFTENVSSHGMRVRTVRFWEPGSQALIKSDRKSTRLNSSHRTISYAVFCLKKKNHQMSRVQPRDFDNAVELVLTHLPKFVLYSTYGNLYSVIYLPIIILSMARMHLGARLQS